MSLILGEKETVESLQKQGVSVSEIARRLGLTRQAVYRRLRAKERPVIKPDKTLHDERIGQEIVEAKERAVARTEMLWYDKLEQSMEQFERLIESEDISDSVRVAAISGKANLAAQVLKAWAQMQAHAVKRDPTLIPEIQILIARVLDALEPFEEAKEAVRKVLR